MQKEYDDQVEGVPQRDSQRRLFQFLNDFVVCACCNKLFRAGSQSVVAGQPKVPKVIQLSLIDSWLMNVLKTLAVSGMAKGVPDDKRDTFFFRFGKTEEVCTTHIDCHHAKMCPFIFKHFLMNTGKLQSSAGKIFLIRASCSLGVSLP